MAKLVMERRAADNAYLPQDFHGALSRGLEYLEERYGAEGVRDYLRQFTRAFYWPLTEQVKRRGLVALQEHFIRVYEIEGGEVRLALTDEELLIEVAFCPAVKHLRDHCYRVAPRWHETTRIVNEALVEGTPFAAELLAYDPETGRSRQRFYRSRA